ncbi:MAG TPA: hypothetical protein VFM98_00895 [Ramlibacter sp.]|uniref:hypothetical protein n=1 Tax=Ramlibacter sp. TaxID=1917967 RepID=UPI002D7E1FEC|nr:hypothetical protein [Ramlibacter sp.]HET8744132.1 hypothetical protein [Ramlibacter sp.]
MKNLPTLILALALAGALPAARAQDGHDHGHDHDTPAATGPASPRLNAQSDLFELVGIVEHGVMTVYLDRFASNEPVAGARIEYEAGPHKGVAEPQADGTYRIAVDALKREGELPFAFTVTAGSDMDLLAGELDLHVEEAHGAEPASRTLPQWALPAAAAAAAIALAAVILGRRRTGSAA